ncbi:MAG: hypothetical protein JWM11_5970 [Planctomycetaceae bacterium]|nr:hypothetical protein [Planctomycetaceae bacterium]
MSIVNHILTSLTDLLLSPWTFQSPWPALIFASLAVSGILLGLFRLSSNQTAMRRARDRLIARVLELLLFRHDLRVSLTACWRIALANGSYLSTFVIPMLVSILPLWCMFAQLSAWFEYRPLRVSESAVVEIELDPAYAVLQSSTRITTSDSLSLVNPGVRIPLRNELCLSVRAHEIGVGWIEIEVGGLVERRSILVEERLARVAPKCQRPGWWREFLHPTETVLSRDSPVVRFDVRYPTRQLWLGDREMHWTIVAFVLIMVFSLGLGKLFGIRIA